MKKTTQSTVVVTPTGVTGQGVLRIDRNASTQVPTSQDFDPFAGYDLFPTTVADHYRPLVDVHANVGTSTVNTSTGEDSLDRIGDLFLSRGPTGDLVKDDKLTHQRRQARLSYAAETANNNNTTTHSLPVTQVTSALHINQSGSGETSSQPSTLRVVDVTQSEHGDDVQSHHGDDVQSHHGDDVQSHHGDDVQSHHGDDAQSEHGDDAQSEHGDVKHAGGVEVIDIQVDSHAPPPPAVPAQIPEQAAAAPPKSGGWFFSGWFTKTKKPAPAPKKVDSFAGRQEGKGCGSIFSSKPSSRLPVRPVNLD